MKDGVVLMLSLASMMVGFTLALLAIAVVTVEMANGIFRLVCSAGVCGPLATAISLLVVGVALSLMGYIPMKIMDA